MTSARRLLKTLWLPLLVAAALAPPPAPAQTLSFGAQTISNQTYLFNFSIVSLTLPQAGGGSGDISYTLQPALPDGLSFDMNTRVLSGAPTTATAATAYTYTALDASDTTTNPSLRFTLAVSPHIAGNLEEAQTGSVSSPPARYSPFRTGDNPGGYILNQVVFPSLPTAARIYAAAGNNPDNSYVPPRLTAPGTTPVDGSYTFTPSGRVVLTPNTTYFVNVFSSAGAMTTNSPNQTSFDGWNITRRLVWSDGTVWGSRNNEVLRFAISATPVLSLLTGMTVRPAFSGQLLARWGEAGGVLPSLSFSHYALASRESGTTVMFRDCGRVNDVAATQGICSGLTDETEYELRVQAMGAAGVLGMPSTATGVPKTLSVGWDRRSISLSGRSSATISVVASHAPPRPFTIRPQGEPFFQEPEVQHGGRPYVTVQYPDGSGGGHPGDNLLKVVTFDVNTTAIPIIMTANNRPIKGTALWTISLVDRDRQTVVSRGSIRIDVHPSPPTAVAGADLTVTVGNYIRLDGSQSLTDVGDVCCPTPHLSSLAYAWEPISAGITLSNAGTVTAGFIAPAFASDTTLSFRLTVRDFVPGESWSAGSHSDEVNVTVLAAPAALTAEVSGTLSVTPARTVVAIGDVLTVSSGMTAGVTIAYEWWRSENAVVEQGDIYRASAATLTATAADSGYWLIPAARLSTAGGRSATPLSGRALPVMVPDVTFTVSVPAEPVAGATVWRTVVEGGTAHPGRRFQYLFQRRPSPVAVWQTISTQTSPSGNNQSDDYPGGNQPIPQSLAGYQLRTEVRHVGLNGLVSANLHSAESSAMVLAAAPSGVTFTGTLQRGSVLTATVMPSALPLNHEVLYRWYRHTSTGDTSGDAIAAAAAMTYTLDVADMERYISVAVRYRLIGSERTSAETRSVIKANAVSGSLAFLSGSIPDQVLVKDSAVSLTLPEARGGQGNKMYALSPPVSDAITGLSFTAGTRVLSGTPSAATAAIAFTYSARSEGEGETSAPESVTLSFTMRVVEDVRMRLRVFLEGPLR